jgi:anti-sigma regulatory factor (Ser/Thr protein kinase)
VAPGTDATPASRRDAVVSGALSHQALIHNSQAQLTDAAAAFVTLGLESGDPVLVAAEAQTVGALRAELGADAGLVELHESSEWFPRPYERLQELRRRAAEVPDGGHLHVVDEWSWGSSGAAAREWARFESVLNLVLADAPLLLLCPFDQRVVSHAVLEAARRTHPELIEGGAAVTSSEFIPPGAYLSPAPAKPPEDAVTLPAAWPELREAVRAHAERVAMGPKRTDDLVLAVQEIATNAGVHGSPPVHAQLWDHADELVCQVSDGGGGRLDPHTGWVPPDDPGGGGWGLPIARLTSDALEISAGPERTVVTLFVSLAS